MNFDGSQLQFFTSYVTYDTITRYKDTLGGMTTVSNQLMD